MSDIALVVMARYPVEGQTKTRLARTLGDKTTVALYQAFLTDLARRFAGGEYALHWTYTPPDVDYQAFISSLAPEQAKDMDCFPQQGDEFAARLHHAFKWTRKRGFARTIVIGSDSPHISHTLVKDAVTALDHADVVLGPADDGGYYLIAMREPHDVFTGVPMSTDAVTRMTIESAVKQGLRTSLISSLFDVDEFSDLQRLAQLLQADSSQAPATAAYLATMRNLHDYDTHTHITTLDLY